MPRFHVRAMRPWVVFTASAAVSLPSAIAAEVFFSAVFSADLAVRFLSSSRLFVFARFFADLILGNVCSFNPDSSLRQFSLYSTLSEIVNTPGEIFHARMHRKFLQHSTGASHPATFAVDWEQFCLACYPNSAPATGITEGLRDI